MTQGGGGFAGDGHGRHVEELQVRRRCAGDRLDHLHGVGALDLEAVGLAARRIGPAHGALVQLDLDVVAAGLGVEADPVQHWNTADQIELVLAQIEQDDVADNIAVIAARHELLGFVDGEILQAVDAQIGQQLQGARAFHQQVGHMVGLVEQNAGLLPGDLLVTPVGVFGRNARIGVGAGLLVTQKLGDVLFRTQDGFEIAGHGRVSSDRFLFGTSGRLARLWRDYWKMTVRMPVTRMRRSACHLTARARTTASTSRPWAT